MPGETVKNTIIIWDFNVSYADQENKMDKKKVKI